MWSAWKWVSTSSWDAAAPRAVAGTGPSRRVRAGVHDHGRPWCAPCSTRPSPWPTSHATMTQPRGGQPGVGSGTSSTRAPSPTPGPGAGRRASTAPRNSAGQHAEDRQQAMPSGAGRPVETAATGRLAACTATAMIHDAHQPAGAATHRPTSGARSPTTPPARPRTVAGPTAGAASRLATTATRRHLAGERRDDRRAGELGRERHRRPPQPPSAAANAAAGRASPVRTRGCPRSPAPRARTRATAPARDRAAAAGAPRRPARGRHGRARDAHAEQGDRAHHRRPQDAGLGAREQHEAEHAEHADDDQAAGAHARPAGQEQQGSRPPGSGWCPTPRAGG